MTQHEKWLKQVLDLVDGGRQEAEEYLRPLLKRCHAKSRKTFVTWVQMQLSRSGLTEDSLVLVSDLKLPPEEIAPHQREGFRYAVNGSTALIEVVDGDDVAIWQVPASRLNWALSLHPIFLRRLPNLEPREIAELRRLQNQLKKRFRFSVEQQRAMESQIAELRSQAQRLFVPAPRFVLIKYRDGERVEVHRLFVDAGRWDEVEALDGNYLNFCDINVTVTTEPVVEKGLCVKKGDAIPQATTAVLSVPNLQIVHSDKSQRKFEATKLQYKLTKQGDINVSLNPERPVAATIPD